VTRANATPRIPDRPNLRPHQSTYGATSPFTPRARPCSTLGQADGPGEDPVDPLRESPAPFGINSQSGESRPESEESSGDHNKKLKKTPPMAIPKHKQSPEPAGSAMLYGSFVPTPPTKARPFELPDPAVSPQTPIGDSPSSPTVSRPTHLSRSASISVPQMFHATGLLLPRCGLIYRKARADDHICGECFLWAHHYQNMIPLDYK